MLISRSCFYIVQVKADYHKVEASDFSGWLTGGEVPLHLQANGHWQRQNTRRGSEESQCHQIPKDDL